MPHGSVMSTMSGLFTIASVSFSRDKNENENMTFFCRMLVCAVFCIPEGSLRDPLGIPYFPHEGPSFPEGSCGEAIFRRYFPLHSEE